MVDAALITRLLLNLESYQRDLDSVQDMQLEAFGASGFVGGFSADESRLDRHQGGAD
jgi:hypothetical protein